MLVSSDRELRLLTEAVKEDRLDIDVRTENEQTTVAPKGKLTLGEDLQLLRETIDGLLEEGCRHFTLDLQAVAYCDSAGLGEIFRTSATIVRHGGTLKLLNATKRMTDLLTIIKS